MITKTEIKQLVFDVVGAAIEVHKHLGPGLLESIYHKCMIKELSLRGISFQSELTIPLEYKGLQLESDLRCDLFIDKILVLELKACEKINPVEVSKLLSYMHQLNAPIGLIINFNVTNIYNEGQKSYVNELYRQIKL